MPEILSLTIQPTHYVVTIEQFGRTFEFEGPRFTGSYQDSQFPEGRVQILDYGIALWGTGRVRTVYPWSTVQQIEEVF